MTTLQINKGSSFYEMQVSDKESELNIIVAGDNNNGGVWKMKVKDIIEAIKREWPNAIINRDLRTAIKNRRDDAVSEVRRDIEAVTEYNRNLYYGHCMNGGGGRKQFNKMYN